MRRCRSLQSRIRRLHGSKERCFLRDYVDLLNASRRRNHIDLPKRYPTGEYRDLADRFDPKLKRRSQAMPPPYIPNPAFQRPLPAEQGYRLPIKALDVPRYLSSFEVFCPKRRTCHGLSYSQPDTLSTSKTRRPLFPGAWL